MIAYLLIYEETAWTSFEKDQKGLTVEHVRRVERYLSLMGSGVCGVIFVISLSSAHTICYRSKDSVRLAP